MLLFYLWSLGLVCWLGGVRNSSAGGSRLRHISWKRWITQGGSFAETCQSWTNNLCVNKRKSQTYWLCVMTVPAPLLRVEVVTQCYASLANPTAQSRRMTGQPPHPLWASDQRWSRCWSLVTHIRNHLVCVCVFALLSASLSRVLGVFWLTRQHPRLLPVSLNACVSWHPETPCWC